MGLAGLITSGLAWGAHGQGWFTLDSSALNNGVSVLAPGASYTGVFGAEVWELNATNSGLVDAINFGLDDSSSYALLTANGFKLEDRFFGQTMTNGVVALGACRLPDVAPAGSTVTLVLAVWNTSAQTFLAAEGSAALTGLIALLQPTTDYNASQPKSPPPLAWASSQNLVLNTLEPAPFIASQPKDATAVLGGTVVFTVTVAGEDPFDYHWRFNDNEIPPATVTSLASTNAAFPQWTTYSLVLTNVQLSSAGHYSFFYTNTTGLWGSLVSSNAELTVAFPPLNLSVAGAHQGVTLSWPIWATNYVLETTRSLGSAASWSTLTNAVAASGKILVTTNTLSGGLGFYRLRSP